jgi:hypothetical protein
MIQAKNPAISVETAPLTSDVPAELIRGPGNRKGAAQSTVRARQMT